MVAFAWDCPLSDLSFFFSVLSCWNNAKLWQDNGNQKERFNPIFRMAASIRIFGIRVWNLLETSLSIFYIRISGLILANRLMGWLYCRYNSWLYLDFEHRQRSAFSTVKTFAVRLIRETTAIEYRLPRAALWLVSAAMTINPVSIFSGNVACLGLRKADFWPSQLSLPSGSVLVRFLNCNLMK